MATVVARYIGSDGTILLPIPKSETNTSNLISSKGVYYIVQTEEQMAIETGNPIGLLLALTYTTEQTAIEAGNPMGLLLTLTYPATP